MLLVTLCSFASLTKESSKQIQSRINFFATPSVSFNLFIKIILNNLLIYHFQRIDVLEQIG